MLATSHCPVLGETVRWFATPPRVAGPASLTEIAAAERINKSNVCRILRLALQAPEIVEAILGGWADQRVMLERLERPLPVAWDEQRAQVYGG
jgi:hypothetical protein